MKRYYDQNIKPLADKLDELTGTVHLKVEYKGGEQQISVVVGDYCNHYGAEMETVSLARWDDDSHEYTNDDSMDVLVCRCGDQFINGEWI